jgi:CBS domain-containing protein
MSPDTGHLDLNVLFRDTRVADLVLAAVPVLSPDATVADAADAMRQVGHGSVVVCEQGRLVGIFTERDLLRIAAEDDGFDRVLSQVMTRRPKTVSATDTVRDVVRRMDQGGYRRLPVVDEAGTPIGLIDVKTIVTFVVEHMPHTVYNQASHQLLTASRREGA